MLEERAPLRIEFFEMLQRREIMAGNAGEQNDPSMKTADEVRVKSRDHTLEITLLRSPSQSRTLSLTHSLALSNSHSQTHDAHNRSFRFAHTHVALQLCPHVFCGDFFYNYSSQLNHAMSNAHFWGIYTSTWSSHMSHSNCVPTCSPEPFYENFLLD